MNADLGPYPEYKESGVPWLGRIPKHWDCLPHRALFEEIKEQGHLDESLLSVTIGRGIIRQEDLLANSSKKDSSNLDKSKYKLVEPGDIAYNKMRAWQGAVGVSQYRGIVSPAYIVQRVRNEHKPEFFHYLFRTPGFAKEAERWSYGITSDQWSLRPQHFKMIYSCVPPQAEQAAIIRFLRGFDRDFRRFIHNRRRLMKVLNEQKQSIINQAVTRGIDPKASLKSSGIDWLGYIPEHWEVMPIKRMLSRTDYGISESVRGEGQYKVLTMGNIQNGGVILDNCGRVNQVNTRLLLDYHDLLYNRTNSLELVAKVGLFEGVREDNITFASYLVRMKTNKSTLPKYANYLLNSSSVLAFARLNAIPSLHQANLNPNRYGKLPVPLPPRSEQARILGFIEEHCKGIDRSLKQARREIDLTREYRTRLISDVVTGKVDVRHLATPLGSADMKDLTEALELQDGEPGEFDEDTTDAEVFHADD